LPLVDEIALAFRHWPEAVVMIDDFAVPGDPGYGFDVYGAGQALRLDYLAANGVLSPGVWFAACAAPPRKSSAAVSISPALGRP
jgi:hypothetical protein